jgi:ribosomal protein L40E
MSTAYRPRQTDQPWLRETAATRQNDAFMTWYWRIWVVAPLLLIPAGGMAVATSYAALGVVGLLLKAGNQLQLYDVKFCPDCKAGNPIDADVCQRCGARPAAEGDAPCAAC